MKQIRVQKEERRINMQGRRRIKWSFWFCCWCV